MAETFFTIQEAADLSRKSIQTIRRAIKGNRISSKRKRTPQGFNYLISRESLMRFYKFQATLFDRQPDGLESGRKNLTGENVTGKDVTSEDLKKLREDIENILAHNKADNKKELEHFVRFMQAFQEKFVALENQLKLLEQPKRKWYQFWG